MTNHPSRPRGFRSRQRQRGAAAVFAAIALVAMLAALALAVDVGRLYFADRDLQRLANLAALDAVRVASGCSTDGHPGDLSAVTAEVQASLTRNQTASDLAGTTATTEIGRRVPGGNIRTFESLAESNPLRNAVRVTLNRQSPARIMPLISAGAPVVLTAVAVAEQPATGKFHVGSTIASLNGGAINTLLGPLLCEDSDAACKSGVLALNVGSSATGLASVGVSANQLATALGLSVQDLSNPVTLAAQTPVLSDVLSGLASSLSGTASATVVGLLQQLGGLASNDSPIPLAQLLGQVNEAAPDAPLVDLFDLLMGLAQAANADPSGLSAIKLPISVSAPGVLTAQAFLKVLESPRFGDGPAGSENATAKTSQVRLEVRLETGAVINAPLTVAATAINVAAGLLGVHADAHVPIRLGIDVEAASAIARLDNLQCPISGINNGMPVARISVDSSVANASVGTFNGSASSAPALIAGSSVPLLSVSGGAINLNLALGLTANMGNAGGGSTDLEPITAFEKTSPSDGGPDYYLADGSPDSDTSAAANPQTVQSGTTLSLGLTPPASGTVSFPGLVGAAVNPLVNGLLNTVTATLLPTLNTALGAVTGSLGGLLSALGVGLGGATVTMNTVSVEQPTLINLNE